MRLFLIRHPRPTGGDGVCYGRTDLDVAPDVVDSAVHRALRSLPATVNAVISSPLRRCSVVAEGLADQLTATGRLVDSGLDNPSSTSEVVESVQATHRDRLMLDPRLTEIDFGQWEGAPWDDIDRETFDEWVGDYVNRPAPGGESWGDVRSRVGRFVDEMRASAGRSEGADHTVVAVTHAGVMRSILSIIVAMPLESTWHIHVPFDAFIECEIAADAQYDRLIALH